MELFREVEVEGTEGLGALQSQDVRSAPQIVARRNQRRGLLQQLLQAA